ATRRAAAVHSRVADPDDEDALPDRVDVIEGDGFQPVDADVNAVSIVPAGDLEVLAARGAAANEDGVEAAIGRWLWTVDPEVRVGARALWGFRPPVTVLRHAWFPHVRLPGTLWGGGDCELRLAIQQ